MIHDSSTIRYTGIGSGSELVSGATRSKRPSSGAAKTFEEIRDECLQKGRLWEDPDFPATDSSIFYQKAPSVWPGIEWERPPKICDRPEMFVGGATRLDVNQGALGDCWLLAAVSCLATNERLLQNVVVPDQSFDKDYAGIFRFRFWSYGHWIEVLVDDRLPTKYEKLIYMHSQERSEFWSALLEKAYAKLNGSYESLTGGLTIEALTDFTGGVAARHVLRDETPPDLFQIMLKAMNNGALMGCSIDAEASAREQQLPNGLLIGHAYSITDVRLIDVKTSSKSGQIQMIRVRNPWGDDHEWKGAWSDRSDEWKFVPEDEKKAIGLVYSHDGEFWMNYKDFVQNFQRLEICFLGPDGLALNSVLGSGGDGRVEDQNSIKWESNIQEGSWQRNINAGGCRNYPKTFWTNPQYRVSVVDQDTGDTDPGQGTVIIGVMQKDRRKLKKSAKGNLVIGYYVFQLPDKNSGNLGSSFFRDNQPSAKSPEFSDLREVSGVHKLPLGHYVVMPTTFEPNQEGDFILRLFSERKADELKVLDERTKSKDTPSQDITDGLTEEDKANKKRAKQAYIDLAGKDGEIDAYELMEFLNKVFPSSEYKSDGFSADMTRIMVALKDTDLTGKLGYDEFKSIWTDLVYCAKVFRRLDSDGSGYFCGFELRAAFHILGITVSNATFTAICRRHSDNEGRISFDDFVLCYFKLKSTFAQFARQDPDGNEKANFSYEEFLKMSMYS